MKPDRLTRFLHDKARIVPAFVDQSMRDLYTQRSCTPGPFRTSQSRRQEVRLAADDVLGRRHPRRPRRHPRVDRLLRHRPRLPPPPRGAPPDVLPLPGRSRGLAR
ncbi:hypothetical protein O1L55_34440 [Streptomyces albulus]|nr:hypothetical protein [Streptomyces noursei]